MRREQVVFKLTNNNLLQTCAAEVSLYGSTERESCKPSGTFISGAYLPFNIQNFFSSASKDHQKTQMWKEGI